MENKEIYVDGVDVSECELYREDNGVFAPDGTAERTELCYLTNDYCGNNPNCYYKQLKRKEQECEELKRQRQSDKGLITATGKMNYELLQEYDKLKTVLTEIKELCKRQDLNQGSRCIHILQKISEVENGK